MDDVVERITAAVEGYCSCGCGQKISPASPSAYFAREHCARRWTAKQRGEPEPPDPDEPPASPAPPRAPSTPQRAPGQPPTSGVAQMLREGWRYATTNSPVPWLRWCDQCRQHVTPVDGMRALPITFDVIERPAIEPLELERANICPSCAQAFTGPHFTAMWRHGPHDTYQCALVTGQRYVAQLVTRTALRYAREARQLLAIVWRDVERSLLEQLAPRCEHPAGCDHAARFRYELRVPIQYAGSWRHPGRPLLLCARHGDELHRHIYTSAETLLGPLRAAYEQYQRDALDWTRR